MPVAACIYVPLYNLLFLGLVLVCCGATVALYHLLFLVLVCCGATVAFVHVLQEHHHRADGTPRAQRESNADAVTTINAPSYRPRAVSPTDSEVDEGRLSVEENDPKRGEAVQVYICASSTTCFKIRRFDNSSARHGHK